MHKYLTWLTRYYRRATLSVKTIKGALQLKSIDAFSYVLELPQQKCTANEIMNCLAEKLCVWQPLTLELNFDGATLEEHGVDNMACLLEALSLNIREIHLQLTEDEALITSSLPHYQQHLEQQLQHIEKSLYDEFSHTQPLWQRYVQLQTQQQLLHTIKQKMPALLSRFAHCVRVTSVRDTRQKSRALGWRKLTFNALCYVCLGVILQSQALAKQQLMAEEQHLSVIEHKTQSRAQLIDELYAMTITSKAQRNYIRKALQKLLMPQLIAELERELQAEITDQKAYQQALFYMRLVENNYAPTVYNFVGHEKLLTLLQRSFYQTQLEDFSATSITRVSDQLRQISPLRKLYYLYRHRQSCHYPSSIKALAIDLSAVHPCLFHELKSVSTEQMRELVEGFYRLDHFASAQQQINPVILYRQIHALHQSNQATLSRQIIHVFVPIQLTASNLRASLSRLQGLAQLKPAPFFPLRPLTAAQEEELKRCLDSWLAKSLAFSALPPRKQIQFIESLSKALADLSFTDEFYHLLTRVYRDRLQHLHEELLADHFHQTIKAKLSALIQKYPFNSHASAVVQLSDLTWLLASLPQPSSQATSYRLPVISHYLALLASLQQARSTTVLTLTPEHIDASLQACEISINTHKITSDHGPLQYQRMSLTVLEPDNWVKVRITPVQGQASVREYHGLWALLQFLQDVRVQQSQKPEQYSIQLAHAGQHCSFQMHTQLPPVLISGEVFASLQQYLPKQEYTHAKLATHTEHG